MTKLKNTIWILEWIIFPVKTAPLEICCNIGITVWERDLDMQEEVEKKVSVCKL